MADSRFPVMFRASSPVRRAVRGGALAAAGLGAAVVAGAQYGYFPDQPELVTVAELSRLPGRYHEEAVLVRGKLGFSFGTDHRVQVLEDRDEIGREILMAASYMSGNELMFLGSTEVEAEGWFFSTRLLDAYTLQMHPILRNYPFDPAWISGNSLDTRTEGFLAVVNVTPIGDSEDLADKREREAKAEMEAGDRIHIAPGSAAPVSLPDLLGGPDPWMNRRVEVVGKFRGNNLFGDLSIKEKKTPRDFVIKTADAAIWVTGMRPAGKGFRLDPKRRRDTGKWLRVYGRPWTADGRVYLRAERIEIAEAPADPALEPVDIRVAEREAREAEFGPLRVVFSLPLDGEREIPLDSAFRVQFSNRMVADSFHASVDLLYENDPDANPFPDLEVRYDEGNRTLIVEPHASLEPDREIHLVLYGDIRDEHGQNIEPEPDAADWGEGAAQVLSFRTAPS